MQLQTFIERVKAFFTRKKIIWTVIILLVLFGGWFLFGRKSAGGNIQTDFVKRMDIEKTVLTTGQVVSSTDLDLGFQTGGIVRRINVKEGDKVGAGETLAVLDQSSALASLASAKASYEKVKAAATPQDVAVSQAAVDTATTALSNAKQNLFNGLSTAYNNANTAVLSNTNALFSNSQSSNPQFGIPGTVITNQQLASSVNSERAAINSSLVLWQTEISTLSESSVDKVTTDSLANLFAVSNYMTDVISLLTSYTQVTSGGSQATVSSDAASVVSGKSTVDAAYTAVTTYSQAVKSAQASLSQAQAALSLKQAPARQEDVDIAAAQVQAAQVILDNTVLVAPANGTITQVDVKLGEQAQAMKEAMKLQNVGQLHTEALVSEADIASVGVGQTIDNTFDALGPYQHFKSTVLTVNPASTVISGVVDYKVTGSLENIPQVKPGMTANMTILVAEKKGVLAIPSGAIVNRSEKRYVKVIDDPKKKTYHEVEVTTGLEADGGFTEVLSGLTEGQEIVTYIK